jgi:hypothetical protein
MKYARMYELLNPYPRAFDSVLSAAAACVLLLSAVCLGSVWIWRMHDMHGMKGIKCSVLLRPVCCC